MILLMRFNKTSNYILWMSGSLCLLILGCLVFSFWLLLSILFFLFLLIVLFLLFTFLCSLFSILDLRNRCTMYTLCSLRSLLRLLLLRLRFLRLPLLSSHLTWCSLFWFLLAQLILFLFLLFLVVYLFILLALLLIKPINLSTPRILAYNLLSWFLLLGYLGDLLWVRWLNLGQSWCEWGPWVLICTSWLLWNRERGELLLLFLLLLKLFDEELILISCPLNLRDFFLKKLKLFLRIFLRLMVLSNLLLYESNSLENTLNLIGLFQLNSALLVTLLENPIHSFWKWTDKLQSLSYHWGVLLNHSIQFFIMAWVVLIFTLVYLLTFSVTSDLSLDSYDVFLQTLNISHESANFRVIRAIKSEVTLSSASSKCN